MATATVLAPNEMQAGEIKTPAPESKKVHHGSIRVRRAVSLTIVYLILIVMSVVWLAPIVWIVLQSFTGQDLQSVSFLYPHIWDFQVKNGDPVIMNGQATGDTYKYTLGWFGNYVFLFKNLHYANGIVETSSYNFFGYSDASGFHMGGFLNTLVISILVAIISTLFVLATSFAFSRLRFKGRTFMMKTIMVLGMFPGFLGLIILYNMFRLMASNYGMTLFYKSIWALVLIYSGGAGMGYYISKGFFDTISKQIDEAAMIDGATRFQIFYKITLPLSKPIVVYTILTSFMGPWAEYITASYILGGQSGARDNWTVPLILYHMMLDGQPTNTIGYWGQFCAGAVIIAIPTSLLFIFLQKNYVSGVTGGAVKG
jgi:arabinogalactan oligomer/maltooligosaccharide transport system permease protein